MFNLWSEIVDLHSTKHAPVWKDVYRGMLYRITTIKPLKMWRVFFVGGSQVEFDIYWLPLSFFVQHSMSFNVGNDRPSSASSILMTFIRQGNIQVQNVSYTLNRTSKFSCLKIVSLQTNNVWLISIELTTHLSNTFMWTIHILYTTVERTNTLVCHYPEHIYNCWCECLLHELAMKIPFLINNSACHDWSTINLTPIILRFMLGMLVSF